MNRTVLMVRLILIGIGLQILFREIQQYRQRHKGGGDRREINRRWRWWFRGLTTALGSFLLIGVLLFLFHYIGPGLWVLYGTMMLGVLIAVVGKPSTQVEPAPPGPGPDV